MYICKVYSHSMVYGRMRGKIFCCLSRPLFSPSPLPSFQSHISTIYICMYVYRMWLKASFMISLAWQIQHKQRSFKRWTSLIYSLKAKRRPKSTNKNENWEAIKCRRPHSHPQANTEIKVSQEKYVLNATMKNV